MRKDKSKAIAIALILLFAMNISIVALPLANAQSKVATYPYIGALPNPVGVGQEVLLHVGITKELYSSEMGWDDMSVTIKKPDGTTETISGIRTDSTGGTGRVYVPTMAGNYTLQAHFPEQVLTSTKIAGGFFTQQFPAGTIMLASDSDILTLVVQEEPIQYYPAHPLPTEYWSRPIDTQIREWSAIAGNWLETPLNYFAIGNEYAPETAHILWTKVMTQGGIVGEPRGQQSFEMGDAYEGKFANRFILAGKLYYDKYASPDPFHEIVCVDLHTGEQLWSKVLLNNLTVSFGQLMYWDTYDYHGVYDYLWATGNAGTRTLLGLPSTAGNPLCAFDPMTGDFVYALYAMPSGTRVMGPKGEILYYSVDLARGYITLWNSTNIPALYASTVYGSMGWGQWRAMGKVVNATGATVTAPGTPYGGTPLGLAGYQYNVSIAGRLGERSLPGSVITIFEGDKVIGGSISTSEVRLWGINLNPSKGAIGTVLFNNTWSAPAYWAQGNLTVSGFAAGWAAWSKEDNVIVSWIRETREHYGFSLETGQNIWGPTEPQYYLDSIEDSPADVRNIAYGKLYVTSVSGIAYCYDVKTGKRLWTYEANDPFSEILWANNWWLKQVVITDGKLYMGHCEHSPIDPRPRGAPFICLNATTGEVIWRVDGLFRQTRWGGRGIMGDSILATQDTYDQRIYAIGKGPSATTVQAPMTGITAGDAIVIQGTVTDISPGTENYLLRARFPSGVPAVSDESMGDWMLYVHKEFPRPTDTTGVEVTLDAIDPNGNFIHIGTATSDSSGLYSYAWTTPNVPGKYTIIATFPGSKAYYPSYAETAALVTDAPAATAQPTPTPTSMAELYFLPMSVGIILAIIVATIVIVLVLRKRP